MDRDPGVPSGLATVHGPWPFIGRATELDLFADTLARASVRAVVIHGPAGVGKTRLADECSHMVRRGGRGGGRASATTGVAGVPLGALAPLLPPELLAQRFDPVALYSTVRAALMTRADAAAGPYVLLVDDLHLLDATSATLVAQLLDAGALFLIGTVRENERMPDAVVDLWRREDVTRIDLGHLSTDDVDALLHLALGGPVDGPTLEKLWAASRGNALFLRELVLGAVASERLVDERGVWRLRGALPATPRLLQLVELRIGAVDGPARRALDLLALWEPVGLAELETLAGRDALDALDRDGLIHIEFEDRRRQVRLSHPLHSEALRAHLPTLVRSDLLLGHAQRIEAHGARRREDPLRIANARLDAAGSADPDLLVLAARLARYGHDFPQVERLARAALVVQYAPEAALLLGEALHELGSFVEADEVLAAAVDPFAAADERLAVRLVAMRVRNLVWGLQRSDDALAVNRDAQARAATAEGRDELRTDEALVLHVSGRPLDALRALGTGPSPGRRGRVLRAITEIPALVVTGRPETAIVRAREAYVEHLQLDDLVAIAPPEMLCVFEIHALTEAGRLGEAIERAADGRRAASEHGPPDVQMWFAFGLGRAALLCGQPLTSRRWLAEASGLATAAGLDGLRRLILSLSAVVDAWSGNAEEARAAVEELDGLPPFAYLSAEQRLGPAWAAAVAGDVQGARTILREAADAARQSGHRTSEAWLLHDVARLGDANAVAERLGQLRDTCEGELVASYALHADAAARRDPEQLAAAADRFGEMGCLLLAAEAAMGASLAFGRLGDVRRASRQEARGVSFLERCEGARTPGLLRTGGYSPLTSREREIAVLAAQGRPSKEIAEQLYLSVRTVNNHLQRIYTKLGVTSRAELDAALADANPDANTRGSGTA